MASQGPLTVNPPSVACPACDAPHSWTTNFCGQCGARLPRRGPAFAAVGSPQSLRSGKSALSAFRPARCESREATVLFCDVAGFTAISERLDPEDVFAIMERAFGVILDAVHRRAGTVNQFLGDGVMAVFEAAAAPGDHPSRALAAALAIQEELEVLRAQVLRAHGLQFRVRASLHTGAIVVGAIGVDLRADYTALGHTAHVASCLLRIAQPGQVVITDELRRRAAPAVGCQPVGDVAVGSPGSRVPVYAVIHDVSDEFSAAWDEGVDAREVAEAFCA